MDHTIPLPVTEAMLTSNIVEIPPAAWSGIAVYATGETTAIFSGANGTVATLYESLQNGNLNKAPAAEPIWWKPVGLAYRPWSNVTNYGVGEIVTFDHRLKEAQTPGPGHNPATSGTEFWRDLGPSNRWAMFDRQIETQTTHPEKIRIEIGPNGRFDTVALLGVVAASINVTLKKGAVEIYNEDFRMVSYTGIANWWDHYFNRVRRKRLLYLSGLPIITGLTLIVTLTGPGVAIGHMVHGRHRRFGATQIGPELGYIDYSNYGVDEFGRRTIVERDYKKQGSFDVVVAKDYVDSTYEDITDLRGAPALIRASEQYQSMIYFGLITSAKITIPYKRFSILRVQVEDF